MCPWQIQSERNALGALRDPLLYRARRRCGLERATYMGLMPKRGKPPRHIILCEPEKRSIAANKILVRKKDGAAATRICANTIRRRYFGFSGNIFGTSGFCTAKPLYGSRSRSTHRPQKAPVTIRPCHDRVVFRRAEGAPSSKGRITVADAAKPGRQHFSIVQFSFFHSASGLPERAAPRLRADRASDRTFYQKGSTQ